jgi:hypothetical protein
MAHTDDVAWVQLATRVPKALLRAVKLHVVTNDTTVMQFTVEAIEEKLARNVKPRKRA